MSTVNTEFIQNCGHLSGGEQLMVRVAASIWNQDTSINLYELAARLDTTQYIRFIEAMSVLRDLKEEKKENHS
jgi:ABC-type cobalamin/Fe3+-siderophores transport system ATPase subunit